MSRRPGGELNTRPLHFFWICDCSGSMSLDGKIQSLNNAIHEALPHMRRVADENPNALVLVKTLRFSSGARWVTREAVPIDQYQWLDLEADSVPQTPEFAAEFRQRLRREGAKSGDVQVSLLWNNYNDLDLHVTCPHDEEIHFGHKTSRCGGELDVDMNVSPQSDEPVENIYWPAGAQPLGRYKVFVNHYKNHDRQGCDDPTAYRVSIRVGKSVEEFSGSISYGEERKLIREFDVFKELPDSNGGGNTDLGVALRMVAEQLEMPPMSDRALPPVLVLISDGQPTDDFEEGLQAIMRQPWGKKAVRIAIAIGQDADADVLQKFIGHSERKPLQANHPDALIKHIRWVSTNVLKSISSPGSQVAASTDLINNVAIPIPVDVDEGSCENVW